MTALYTTTAAMRNLILRWYGLSVTTALIHFIINKVDAKGHVVLWILVGFRGLFWIIGQCSILPQSWCGWAGVHA